METVTLARHAMATRFELVLNGPNPVSLRAAGEEALDEIDRLEDRLSLFREMSEIAVVNAHAARRPVRVSPEVFALLKHAKQLHERTAGAFDIAVAPLVQCWGFMGGTGRRPSAESLRQARGCSGFHLVRMDDAERTISFARLGVMLDLGAIGKGYAIDRAVTILREAGVESALVHGGTSTVYGLGRPPDRDAWLVAIDSPPGARIAPAVIARVALRDEALSVSGIHGKCFEEAGKILGHILDPRTGEPAAGTVLAAVACPSATDSDALSTALLVIGDPCAPWIASSVPPCRTLVATGTGPEFHARAFGIPLANA